MARAKKFGTFGGVFTPSILTILGVIMYLRLPYIVGQAGMMRTFGIIAVAHIISISTGLSVSSIATDKKVRAGGTYFMISRSLGLPIGGTLGLALFVGLSFSVSLYLIGFSDSFLRVLGLPVDLNTIRLTGSIALVAVTGVTLISTALALKMQYYIMAAIGASLLSIVLGRHDFAPDAASAIGAVAPVATAIPFIVLFGIFFPAVTGFEAGVSMSGDLEDPKRSIPAGTISAIFVGLIVYLALAAFLALTVSSDQLVNNPRVLLDIALFPPLVIAGIWGATISSAFGSILGAPRILQATSADGITPRWFSIGYGKENEPRHALILAFLIAEAGILIGQLDVIARVVSMFFITTYGFLNLTAAIESTVSPDFRPEFRVPRIFGLIGSAACFVVMIQLDFLAMIGASVLLGSVYLFLARRQLRLETGDTWEGIWSTTVRTGLGRLDRGKGHLRNWRPNVMLFSLLEDDAARLVEFGRHLIGRRGILTAFRIDEPSDEVAPPDTEAGAENATGRFAGVFERAVTTVDPFGEMGRIARYYGFAGIEPNTVLLGWRGVGRDSTAFTSTLQALVDEDCNLLLLDHDPERGWGRHAVIDVWWRLAGNDIALSLALIRFLTSSDEWRDASVRFMTVNAEDSALATAVVRTMHAVLEDQRVHAEVRVINNAIANRSFADIVREESVAADLTILGLTDLRRADAGRFVAEIGRLVDSLGSVLLVHASSFFGEPLVRLPRSMPSRSGEATGARVHDSWALAAVVPEAFDVPVTRGAALDDALREAVRSVFEEYVDRCFAVTRSALDRAGIAAVKALEGLGSAAPSVGPIDQARTAVIVSHSAVIDEWSRDGVDLQGALMAGMVDAFARAADDVVHMFPERLTVDPPPGALLSQPGDSLALGARKIWLRFRARLSRRPPSFAVGGRELAGAHVQTFAAATINGALSAIATAAHAGATDLRGIQGAATDAIERVGRRPEGKGVTPDVIAAEANALRGFLEGILRRHDDQRSAALDRAGERAHTAAIGFARDASNLETGSTARRSRRAAAVAIGSIENAGLLSDVWVDAQRRLLASAGLFPALAAMRSRISDGATQLKRRLHDDLIAAGIAKLESLDRAIGQVGGLLDEDAASRLEELSHMPSDFLPDSVIEETRAMVGSAARTLPERLETATDESFERLSQGSLEEVEPLASPLHVIVEYLAETEVVGPLVPELAKAVSVAEEAAAVGLEVGRFIVFHLQRSDDESGTIPASELREVVRTARERLAAGKSLLGQAEDSLRTTIDQGFARLVEQLEPYTLSRPADRWQRLQRERRGREVLGGLSRLRGRVTRALTGRAVDLLYRRSESVLLARRLRRGARRESGSLGEVRRLVESVSPSPSILERLPSHYRHLFSGRVALAVDLRFGFDAELAEAGIAVEAHRRGRDGALLILSERGQGRGSLSRLIGKEHFETGRFHRVEAPDQGSIDIGVFERRLSAATGRSGPPERVLASLPPGSAVLISDIGLWWERSPGGLRVVERIAELVSRFGNRVFFMLGANIHAFRLMRQLGQVEDHLLRTIECQPFSSRQLRDVIMLRHQSSGLSFDLRGRAEDDLSEWRLARLFTAIFDYSEGNVGWALNAWLSHITGVDDDTVRIVAPRRPATDPFDALSAVEIMLLIQLTIHDRLDRDRLSRVTRLDAATMSRELRALEQTGVITHDARGVLRIDRFVRPHLGRFLLERELIL